MATRLLLPESPVFSMHSCRMRKKPLVLSHLLWPAGKTSRSGSWIALIPPHRFDLASHRPAGTKKVYFFEFWLSA